MQRRFRLRHPADFAHLRRDGRTYRHRLLVVSYAPNGLSYNRYGFITVKRLGNAVTRNRVRRLLREAVRLLHPRLRAGYDVVFIARDGLVGQPLGVVQRILNELAVQAGLNESEAA
ncbi:MAG: ribonuclease P protein component [Anaerolineaceae bacterium]|nr:ribonuclease P protein component [Anaerolineaceae bacterium]